MAKIPILGISEDVYDELERLKAENAKLKEAYSEIFENYIPAEKMDEANDRLILLLEDREQMGRDMLKAHPLKGDGNV